MFSTVMSLVKIGKAAGMLGVSVQTLRAWEASGELLPDRRSKGATRYYAVDRIRDLTRHLSHDSRRFLPSPPRLRHQASNSPPTPQDGMGARAAPIGFDRVRVRLLISPTGSASLAVKHGPLPAR